MLKREQYIKRIISALSWLKEVVQTCGSLNLLDVNVVAEDFFADFLNTLYDLKLKNMNRESPNHAGIDLGDDEHKVSYQITSSGDRRKVQGTIDRFVAEGLNSRYDTLRILIIGAKQRTYRSLDSKGLSFDPDTDVIDMRALINEVLTRATEELRSLCAVIETELGTFQRAAVPRTFLRPQQFFAPYFSPGRVFNHSLPLVGQKELLHALCAFATSRKKVAMLSGRGGSGKTRLVWEFTQVLDSREIPGHLRVAAEGASLTRESLEELPASECLIVVDDAQRIVNLSLLLTAARRLESMKVVLITRPYGVQALRSQLDHTGFDLTEIEELSAVSPLAYPAEVEELAEQSLGQFAAYAERLAVVTRDCPLLTVVGGRLLAMNRVSPELLVNDQQFRHTILSRFRDILLGEIAPETDRALYRSILDLIAALAPINRRDEDLIKRMAEFLGVDAARLAKMLDALVAGGALMRGGRLVRIVPDVLSDFILHEACVGDTGEPTGYATRVYEQFESTGSYRVLANLAELDWRLRGPTGQDTCLLDEAWMSISARFSSSPISERCDILYQLEPVAHLLPARVLELIRYAKGHPATATEDPGRGWYTIYGHDDVLRALPPLLERIAWTSEYLRDCCELLRQLVTGDSAVSSAWEVLQRLARYDVYGRYDQNRVVLQAVREWISAGATHVDGRQLLDILDALLVKSGRWDIFKGHTLSYGSFFLRRENIQDIRQGALDLIVEFARGDDLSLILRAVNSLKQALQEPMAFTGEESEQIDREQWIPEQLQVVSILKQLAADNADPLVRLSVFEALTWQASYGPSNPVRQQARLAVASIPDSFEMRLIRLLADCYPVEQYQAEFGGVGNAVELHDRRREIIEALSENVIDQFLVRCPDPAEAVSVLNGTMQRIGESGWHARPWVAWSRFLKGIALRGPEYTLEVCRVVRTLPESQLALRSSNFLIVLHHTNTDQALELMEQFIDSQHPVLCYAVAECYQSVDWGPVGAHEFLQVERLLQHPVEIVREAALRSLFSMKRCQPEIANEMALSTDITGTSELASVVCEVCADTTQRGISLLSDLQLSTLLEKLEGVPNLDDYYIRIILREAAARHPSDLVDFLMRRIRHKSTVTSEYQALPMFDKELESLLKAPDYLGLLRKIRDAVLGEGPFHWNDGIPELFRDVSLRFADTSLPVLQEWATSDASEKHTALTRILSTAPMAFFFDHAELVAIVLRAAYRSGLDHYETVFYNLQSCVKPNEFSRIHGHNSPQIVRLRERASEVADALPAGSFERTFYNTLIRCADEKIAEERQQDEEQDLVAV